MATFVATFVAKCAALGPLPESTCSTKVATKEATKVVVVEPTCWSAWTRGSASLQGSWGRSANRDSRRPLRNRSAELLLGAAQPTKRAERELGAPSQYSEAPRAAILESLSMNLTFVAADLRRLKLSGRTKEIRASLRRLLRFMARRLRGFSIRCPKAFESRSGVKVALRFVASRRDDMHRRILRLLRFPGARPKRWSPHFCPGSPNTPATSRGAARAIPTPFGSRKSCSSKPR